MSLHFYHAIYSTFYCFINFSFPIFHFLWFLSYIYCLIFFLFSSFFPIILCTLFYSYFLFYPIFLTFLSLFLLFIKYFHCFIIFPSSSSIFFPFPSNICFLIVFSFLSLYHLFLNNPLFSYSFHYQKQRQIRKKNSSWNIRNLTSPSHTSKKSQKKNS